MVPQASDSADGGKNANSHEVPDDVFLIVFSLLDVADLLRCAQVCGRFRRLVETDASLQYKIELVKSGMVNGPTGRGTVGTADRLDRLRAYNARLRSGEYTNLQDCPVDSDLDQHGAPSAERVWSTGTSVAYVSRKGDRRELVLSIPPETRVAGEQRRNVRVPLDEFGEDVLVATDYTQDLLVGVSRRIEDCNDFQIRVGSLTSGRLGHPSARDAILPTSAFGIYVQHTPADVHALRIYSQYIFLVVFVDQMGPYDFQIWDWMTGTLLTQTIVASMGTPRFTLIDNEHFAVIGSRDHEIAVYRIPSAADHGATGIPEFRLILPGAGLRPEPHRLRVFFFIHDISVSLPIPPSAHGNDTREPFTMNTDSSVLFINFMTGKGTMGHRHILLVPTSSLRAAMRNASASTQLHTPLGWSEWGGGALLLDRHELEGEEESWICSSNYGRPYGSRMPLLISPEGVETTVGKIVIIEMDPSAVRYSRGMAAASGESDEAKEAMASLQKHVRLSLYGHQLTANYVVYPGPVISLNRLIQPEEIALDEHGFSLLIEGAGDHDDDLIRGFQAWELV